MSQSTPTGHAAAPAKPLPPEPKPQRGPEHERLSVFIGHWRGSGHGGGGKAEVTEVYDWIEGQFFIKARFDQDFGGARHVGVSQIGWDAEAGCYFMQMVDNLGYARNYVLRDEGGGVWSLAGQRERARLTFDGDRLTERWEHRPGGKAWEELCAYELVKGRAEPTH